MKEQVSTLDQTQKDTGLLLTRRVVRPQIVSRSNRYQFGSTKVRSGVRKYGHGVLSGEDPEKEKEKRMQKSCGVSKQSRWTAARGFHRPGEL